ncbi:MAG: hypothetical protein LBL07_05760 [Tannerella sp.]|jgi:hypothetical protein|nr:hypothetical protein [Tannerella sp.]
MATLKAVVRTKKELNTVYIRISHNSHTDYIPTSMIVHKSGVRKGEITDHNVMANCAIMIKKYVDRINNVDISLWTVQEVKKFLVSDSGAISFSDFANVYVNRMRDDGRDKPDANYMAALHSLERYFGKRQIDF